MTDSNPRQSPSSKPDPAVVKEAFAGVFSIADPDQRAEMLDRLDSDSPQVASEVRQLLQALRSSERVEKVSAYVPMLDLSLARPPEQQEEFSDEDHSIDPVNFSVLRSMEKTVASVPHVVLKSSGDEGPIVRVRSSEVDQTWNHVNGRYRLDGEIARGGMGAILKGRDTDLGRDLAVKVLLKEHRDNPETVKRFIEEAQIGGQLQHPGIAPVYELGQFHDERPFFTMKLIKGKTFAALLAERQSVDDDRAKYLGIFEQICQTMAYAHSRGVLHRDLKPSNVMVGAFGEVQVMDWGLAKVLAAGGVADERKQQLQQEDKSLIQTVRSVDSGSTYKDNDSVIRSATRMGSIMGTPAYMSPEQATGEIDRLDQRADVFSLGSILCEILTGNPVYRRGKQMDQLMLARAGNIKEGLERLDASSADAELVRLAKDCLAVDRNDRPSDAEEVSERISDYLESVDRRLREKELEVARTKTKAEEERKRRRVVMALAGCVVLAVLLGAGGWMWVKEKDAQLAQIKADAEVAAAAERFELEQRVQNEMAAAAALADRSEQMPSFRELERAMEAIRRAQADAAGEDVSPALANDLSELHARVTRQQADSKLVKRRVHSHLV
ncbi:protein kinase, partial [Stieleria sp. ICT_E10.1]|uniref:serine/threonine-protein kinase n=1 Tax=Stieleria sedimenti TaxID=2976331 RepID=UPI002180103F